MPNAIGETVTLSQELAKGPVVLIWYRGGWCPYCNIQLKSFQDELETIKAAGAQLIAISPEKPDNSMTTAQKNNLQYHVLSDFDNGAAKEYGLVYTAPDDLKEILPDLNLADHNGVNHREIPLTATYVIESDGTIAYAMITPDYRIRAEPADVITVLGDINARESIKRSRIRQAMEREAEKIDLKNKTQDLDNIEKEMEKTTSRIEKIEDKTVIKPAENFETKVDLKPIVTPPPEGVEAETTLEVRAKEEGLIPESY